MTPSQHTMSDPHRFAHKMPFEMAFRWRADPGPLFLLRFDVNFDMMRKFLLGTKNLR